MILVHLLANSKQEAMNISDFLIKEKLILSALIFKDVFIRSAYNDQELTEEHKVLIMGKTKTSLFEKINTRIKDEFNRIPELYSIPVVHMDWEQATELKEETVEIQ